MSDIDSILVPIYGIITIQINDRASGRCIEQIACIKGNGNRFLNSLILKCLINSIFILKKSFTIM